VLARQEDEWGRKGSGAKRRKRNSSAVMKRMGKKEIGRLMQPE